MKRIIPFVLACSAVLGSAPIASGQGDSLFAVPVGELDFTPLQQEMIEVSVEPTSHAPLGGRTSTQANAEILEDPATVLFQTPQQGTQYCLSAESALSNGTACRTGSCHRSTCTTCCPQSHSSDSYARRIKSILQKCHWGYCNRFDERPLGDAVFTTLSRQVDRGTMNMMTLYHYDFYPEESARAAELTPLGNRQLLKIVERMQTVPAPIVIQITDDKPALDDQRRQQVVQSLAELGVPTSEEFVVLGTERYGARAVEAAETYQNLIRSIQSRGRTIQPPGSARFGGQNR